MQKLNPDLDRLQHLTRRHFLKDASAGVGAAALAGLLRNDAHAASSTDVSREFNRKPHFRPTARRVIYLHLTGSPPHLDLFDYKPELVKRSGEDCPQEYLEGKRFAFTTGVPKLLGTPREFAPRGASGVELSDAIPHLHEVADELCVIRSMNTDQFNHAPAELLVYTGSPRPGRPSFGAWVTYGVLYINCADVKTRQSQRLSPVDQCGFRPKMGYRPATGSRCGRTTGGKNEDIELERRLRSYAAPR